MSKDETKGWICPKCQRVYAPWVDKCQYCGGSTITYTPPTCPYRWWWDYYPHYPYYSNMVSTDSITLKTSDFQTTTTTNSTLNNEVKC